jgi:hypothetical protein
MDKNREIYRIIADNSKVKSIADEILYAFTTEASAENIDYNFTIGRKTGQIKDSSANTFFFFDPKENSDLYYLKKALFSEDLNDISPNSLEEKELMNDVRNFLLKVCQYMTDHYKNEMRDTVRKVILGNRVSEQISPLETIEVVSIDVADYSSVPDSSKYILKVGKVPNTDIDTDKILSFIQDEQEKSAKSFQEIINMEKLAGNSIFNNVLEIQKGKKYLNEISIYFFIDYSLGPEAI